MAPKLYILTEKHFKSGKRPKVTSWKTVCFVLSVLMILENLALLHWFK
jgi:hypothetical protein